MYKLAAFFILMSCLVSTLAQYGRYDQYVNMIRRSDNPSETASQLLALLNQESQSGTNEETDNSNNNYGNTNVIENLFKPPLELLELMETLMRLKGEVVEKISDVIYANRYLLRDTANFLISKAGNVHRFLLNLVTIIRRVLQFAADLFSQWNPDLPPISTTWNRSPYPYRTRVIPHRIVNPTDYDNEVSRK